MSGQRQSNPDFHKDSQFGTNFMGFIRPFAVTFLWMNFPTSTDASLRSFEPLWTVAAANEGQSQLISFLCARTTDSSVAFGHKGWKRTSGSFQENLAQDGEGEWCG
jgi:hypothetical protein